MLDSLQTVKQPEIDCPENIDLKFPGDEVEQRIKTNSPYLEEII